MIDFTIPKETSHLEVAYNEKYRFWKITCQEGHYITDFDAEKDEVKDFYASKEVYCPSEERTKTFYCISDELKEKLDAMAKEAFEKEEAEMMQKLNA